MNFYSVQQNGQEIGLIWAYNAIDAITHYFGKSYLKGIKAVITEPI